MPQKNVVKFYQPQSYYHIYNHSVAELETVFSDKDADYFLRLFERYLGEEIEINKFGYKYQNYNQRIQLLCYCLLPNHLHLLIYQEDKQAINNFMQSLMTAYSIYFNKKYLRRGTVFETTFKASEIANDRYLQHISKYIHLNPNKNEELARHYKYSSYQYYINPNDKPTWLNTDKLLKLFNGKEEYIKFVKQK